MINNILKNENFVLLGEDDLKKVSGGAPDKETSFWYDVAYIVTFWSLAGPKPTAWATGRIR